MANQRAADQIFIGVWIKHSLADKIERARRGPRSQFVRDALADFCAAHGVPLEREERLGAGRIKPKTKYPSSRGRHLQINEPKLRKAKS